MDYGCFIGKGQLMMQIFGDDIHVSLSKRFQGSFCLFSNHLECKVDLKVTFETEGKMKENMIRASSKNQR